MTLSCGCVYLPTFDLYFGFFGFVPVVGWLRIPLAPFTTFGNASYI